MSFESAKKLGVTASLINILLPVVAVILIVAFVIFSIFTAIGGIANGTTPPTFLGITLGFYAFLVVVIGFALAGFIMFMVAMNRLSHYYNEPTIFKNVLYAFILSIISTSIIYVLEFALLFSSLAQISGAGTQPTFAPVFPFFLIVAILAAVAFGIVNGWLYMRAFNKLKEKSGIDDFGTAGILYLIGAIVPLVSWIAWIFAYLGFRKLQPSSAAATTVSYQTQPPISSTAQTKRCPNCGAMNTADALYCSSCGKPLQ